MYSKYVHLYVDRVLCTHSLLCLGESEQWILQHVVLKQFYFTTVSTEQVWNIVRHDSVGKSYPFTLEMYKYRKQRP